MFRSVTLRFSQAVLRQDAKQVANTRSQSTMSKKAPRWTLTERLSRVTPFGYATLTVPVVSMALAVWQIKRSVWKAHLIETLEARLRQKPISLPETLEEISKLEYMPVKITGHFDHSREILVGPRPRLNTKGSPSSLLSNSALAGFCVFTPFKPNDRDYYILVNRGWVHYEQRLPEHRKEGQVEGEVEVVGLIRFNEKKPQFMMENKPEEGKWLYRDLETMAQFAGTAPISIDAVEDSSVPGGPIGGQTLVKLTNVHYSYAFTWFSLSLLSAIIWWKSNVPVALRKASRLPR